MFGKKPSDQSDPAAVHDAPADASHEEEPSGDHTPGEPEPRDPVAEMEQRLAEAESARLRALADYQNFQRRAAVNEREAREQGVRSVLGSILPVLDHFEMALSLDPEKVQADQIIGGVRLIRDELERALALHGVNALNPEPGEEFDPGRHEAVMRQASESVEPGCVLQVLQSGFTIGERTLRPAKVIIADAPAEQPAEGDG